ncbi:terminase small subunit [Enterocloster clostridioformis]|uniref:Phage terminase small subunit n=1 Tax=Enterocloster clostridioformis TaxID=1531 RepID=A0A1I0K7H5_9FIRM|nr:terminase small subunit [Enterocloster clostridioformis]SEU19688.1 phage terminase small subunit [Enterocloster clostridioformis]SEW49081.1 phage terminase small subunit [Enterocloster clostridioformis]
MELTLKQKAFADYYIECGNQTEAAKRAGYSKRTARVIGQENLLKPAISAYIAERQKQIDDCRIADAAEILQYLTSVMRGEVKDQFGLDAPLAERTRAAVELAKRKIDTDKKQEGGGITIVNNIPRPENNKSD